MHAQFNAFYFRRQSEAFSFLCVKGKMLLLLCARVKKVVTCAWQSGEVV